MTDPASSRSIIKASRVFTASSSQLIPNGYVVIDGEMISQVVDPRTEQGRLFEEGLHDRGQGEIAVIDFGDATIMPGLIDTHCHVTLAGDRRTYEEMVAEGNEMMALVAVQQLRRHLESGVTTIRDNGGKDRIPFIVREGTRRGYFPAPRMLLSGRPVTHSSGHFHWCNGVADSPDEIRAAVRMLVADGADHIKIMASGGGTGGNIPYLPSYTIEEMRMAVETAHGLERLTTAHARAASSMVNGIEAGLDCLEHGEFLVPSAMHTHGSGVAASALMEYDPSITERMLRAGTYLSFTMQAGGYDTLLELRAMSESGDTLSSMQRNQIGELERFFDMKSAILEKLLADGAGDFISISTDAGPFDISFGNLVYGLELSVAAGMSPLAALRSSTIIAARICGIEGQVGSLEQGKQADILVVQGDPVSNVSAIRAVREVYLGGRAVPRLGGDVVAAPGTMALSAGQC